MNDDLKKPDPLEEPSVLDYVKSLFRFGNGERIRIPFEQENLLDEEVEKKQSLFEVTPRLQPLDDVQLEPSFVEAPSTDFQPVPGTSKKGLSLHFPGVPCWHSSLRGLHNKRSNLHTLP